MENRENLDGILKDFYNGKVTEQSGFSKLKKYANREDESEAMTNLYKRLKASGDKSSIKKMINLDKEYEEERSKK